MRKSIYDLNKLMLFRQNMHMNPEIAFQEFETSKIIKEYLNKNCEIPYNAFKDCAKTGILLDIFGKAESQGSNQLIGLRADIDALAMKENNQDLQYRSKNDNAAHMCGHDGHTACLLGFASLFIENIDKIPSNKGVRLIFQPAEEYSIVLKTGGAKIMVEEGCLDGVNEIYGYHNMPQLDYGKIYLKAGAVMSEISEIYIRINGKGGHTSALHLCQDPVKAAVEIHSKITELYQKISKNKKIIICIPVINGGTALNVIPDFAELRGSLRVLEEEKGVSDEILKTIEDIIKEVCNKHSCSYESRLNIIYPLLKNTVDETNYAIESAIKYFGDDKVVINDPSLPLYSSEDFSFFTNKIPGCFFFVGSRKGTDFNNIHTSNYNFNDDLIDIVSQYYWKLIQDRFELQL